MSFSLQGRQSRSAKLICEGRGVADQAPAGFLPAPAGRALQLIPFRGTAHLSALLLPSAFLFSN